MFAKSSDENDNIQCRLGKRQFALPFVFSLRDLLPVRMERHARSGNNEGFRDAMREILKPISGSVQSGVPVMFFKRWIIFHPASFSYYGDIPNEKFLAGEKYSETMGPCIRWMIKKHDISEIKNGQVRTGV